MTRRRFKLRLKSAEDSYGVVADSLGSLKHAAKEKFKLPDDADSLSVRLEDGTIVDDEEYFSFVEENTCFVISGEHEGPDEVDGSICYDGAPTLHALRSLSHDQSITDIYRLVSSLQSDITNIAKFSDQQLQTVVDAPEQDLKTRLHLSTDEIDGLQQACHTHIMERQKTSDAVELLKMYRDHVDGRRVTSGSSPVHKKAKRSK